MATNTQLSANFFLSEFLTSQSAVREGITEQFTPPDEVIANVKALCENVLQPMRDIIGVPLHVNSGYRCPRLNEKIGGAKNSQHMTGHAADIECPSLGNEELLRRIASMNLPFDQMINEFNYAWVHISYDIARTRGEILEAYKDENNSTRYRPIIIEAV